MELHTTWFVIGCIAFYCSMFAIAVIWEICDEETLESTTKGEWDD